MIAALFAIRISLHKFASQKWWERREEAYAKIIGILSKIRVYLGNWEGHFLNIKKLKRNGINCRFQTSYIGGKEMKAWLNGVLVKFVKINQIC